LFSDLDLFNFHERFGIRYLSVGEDWYREKSPLRREIEKIDLRSLEILMYGHNDFGIKPIMGS
jgi:hypothetical protein